MCWRASAYARSGAAPLPSGVGDEGQASICSVVVKLKRSEFFCVLMSFFTLKVSFGVSGKWVVCEFAGGDAARLRFKLRACLHHDPHDFDVKVLALVANRNHRNHKNHRNYRNYRNYRNHIN